MRKVILLAFVLALFLSLFVSSTPARAAHCVDQTFLTNITTDLNSISKASNDASKLIGSNLNDATKQHGALATFEKTAIALRQKYEDLVITSACNDFRRATLRFIANAEDIGMISLIFVTDPSTLSVLNERINAQSSRIMQATKTLQQLADAENNSLLGTPTSASTQASIEESCDSFIASFKTDYEKLSKPLTDISKLDKAAFLNAKAKLANIAPEVLILRHKYEDVKTSLECKSMQESAEVLLDNLADVTTFFLIQVFNSEQYAAYKVPSDAAFTRYQTFHNNAAKTLSITVNPTPKQIVVTFTPGGKPTLKVVTKAPQPTQPFTPVQPTKEPTVAVPPTQDTSTSCPNTHATCSQLTCAQAYACLAAGNGTLDQDGDGKPCETKCGG